MKTYFGPWTPQIKQEISKLEGVEYSILGDRIYVSIYEPNDSIHFILTYFGLVDKESL